MCAGDTAFPELLEGGARGDGEGCFVGGDDQKLDDSKDEYQYRGNLGRFQLAGGTFHSALPTKAVSCSGRNREQARSLQESVGFALHVEQFLFGVVLVSGQMQQTVCEKAGDLLDQGDITFIGLQDRLSE